MTAPWMQTATGVAFDLLRPDPASVRFATDVAPALARLARFNGHVSTGPYSVAQHCVIGAEAMLEETGRSHLAALFLVHDAHEAYIGDLTRPVAMALSSLVGAGVGEAIADLRNRIDAAIYAAAAIPPPTLGQKRLVQEMDDRMLETERRQLLCTCERPWGLNTRPVRIRGALRPWAWPDAADRWLALFRQLCPRSTL